MPSRTTPAKSTAKSAAPAAETQPVDPYAPTAWMANGEDLVMPSGQLALVRRAGMDALVSEGILHSMDSLTPLVQNLIGKAEGTSKASKTEMARVAQSIMDDPSKMTDLLHIVDKVVTHVVMKPEIQLAPNDRTSRKPGVIYTDMVAVMDRMFIFSFATSGVRDLEPFRP